MAKRLIVKSGTVYNILAADQAYFDALREGTAIEGKLSDPDRSDVLDIYHRYCQLDSWAGEVKDTVDVVASSMDLVPSHPRVFWPLQKCGQLVCQMLYKRWKGTPKATSFCGI